MVTQEDIKKGAYPLRGGISSQSGTGTQDLTQATSYDLGTAQILMDLIGKPALACGIEYTDSLSSNIRAITAKRAADGTIRLAVDTFGSAVSPAAPGAVSVGVASGALVAANTARRHLVIVNTSNAYVSLGFGAAAVLYSGITLNPLGGSYEMSETQGNLYRGAINAIASAAASNVGVQDDS